MSMFRVVIEMPDGPLQREGGKSSQPLRNEETFYDADSFDQVLKHVKQQMRGTWAEGRLVKIEDIGVPITMLRKVPGKDTIR